MKVKVCILALMALVSVDSFGQFGGRTESVTNRPGNSLIPVTHMRLKTVDKSVLEENVELEKKKYLFFNYNLAAVDDYDTKAYVRYNIYNDEMEFVKDKSIYYLAKEVGRRVVFAVPASIYKVYELNGELQFFKVLVEDKNSLIVKHRVRYVDAKVAKSGYDRAKPADYKRLKDEIYLVIGDKKMVKLSKKKKKEFFTSFGDKASEIKAYMKKNKLGYKSAEDLKKVVEYYNTIQ